MKNVESIKYETHCEINERYALATTFGIKFEAMK